MSRLWINTMEVKQPNNGHLAGAQLFKYAMEGENDNVREMMTTGGLLASDTVGTTALHCAVIGNQLETCELFLQAGVSVDVKTKVDRTPLHFAVFHGHERMVKLLLSKSCEVDPVDMLQMTPLHWAVEKNHVNIARLLLESGASPYSVSKFGKTPKGMAEERDNPSLRRLFSKYDWSETKPKQDEDPRDMVDYALQEDAGSDIENISVFEEDLDEVEVIPAPEMETEEIESANGDVEDVAAAGRLVAHDSDDSFTNLQEAIEKLGDVKEIKPSDPTTLKILQKIGLQITDEHDPSMLMNVLQSGRRIVLSEAGKYILNKTKNNERLDLPDAGSKKQNVPTVPNSTQPPVNKRIRTRESLRADPSSLVKRSRISESERMGTRNKSAADLRELTEEQPPVNGDSATEHEIVDLDEVEEEPEQEHIDLEQVPLQRVQKLEKMVLLLQRDNKELRSMLELSIRQMEESQKRIERLEGKVLKRKED